MLTADWIEFNGATYVAGAESGPEVETYSTAHAAGSASKNWTRLTFGRFREPFFSEQRLDDDDDDDEEP